MPGGVREGIRDTAAVLGRCGLSCCCAAVFGSLERLYLPRCVETQIQTPALDADVVRNRGSICGWGPSRKWYPKKIARKNTIFGSIRLSWALRSENERFEFSKTLHKRRPYANNYGIGKRNKTGLRLCGVETHTRLWLLLFCSKAYPESEKNVFFAQCLTAATSPRLTGHGS